MSDRAPFSLWDVATQDFRNPTPTERGWVITTYSATTVIYAFPEIIIRTSSLPSPVPLTIAGLVAVFLPPGASRSPLGVTTNYANPRLHDPVSHLQLAKWELPAREIRAEIYGVLQELANIKAIYYMPPTIFVELVPDDDRVYNRHSLPGVVGGIPVEYHHSPTPFLAMGAQGRERLMDPGLNSAQDTANYSATGLSPGVRVESGPARRGGGYATTAMATTCGVLIRCNVGGPRLTVANHGFLGTDDVYHPHAGGVHIGEITERFEALGIALVQLYPSVAFQNTDYFQAQPPKRLLRSSEIRYNTWCSLDSMSTGLVFLRVCGVADDKPPRPPGITVPFTEFRTANVYQCIGPIGGVVREGICGAPIVADDPNDGGVLGFFQLGEENCEWAKSPCLDDLLDRGWSLL